MRQPQMPLLTESRDQLDSYLARFEMQAKVNKWPEEQWFMCLSNLLTGEALEVLYALSPDQCTCGRLKASLLKRFKLTEEVSTAKTGTTITATTKFQLSKMG
ncbi:hypothetical protein PoB_002829600 [Plakobranchus ocellatus]|uniref:Uncharacterized protein n=1 Tax=Plakobranchus ocellatus TaxID=259542 RepID=A0AAV4A0U9_9GAST|nr:hypothetical protein PoB_002829600 [Plakobranchus ocellatus]